MTAKRRLLVVSHGFPPYYGGAEHVAGHLAQAASRSGRWQVQVLTSDIGGRLPRHEMQEQVEVFRVPARKKEWTRHTTRELWSFVQAARPFRPETRPDLILAHCALPAGAVARRIARETGAPYGVVLHGSDVPGYQNARFGLVYLAVKPWLRRIWRDAARVIAVSEPLRELALKSWPEGAIETIPNGVDIDRFQPPKPGAEKRSNDRIHILSVAQLIERKGLQFLISALSQWPRALRERVQLCFCGAGPYEGQLRRQAQEMGLAAQIEWAGLLPYDELTARMNASDIFVLPALQEGLPLALLEAIACGLPIVASAVGGIPDVIRDGENGCLTPAGDASALGDALIRVATDSELRARLGAAARQTALSWSWTAVWEKYELLFTEGLEGVHGR